MGQNFSARSARTAALELAFAPRLAAQAELRRPSATAVQGAWPQDIEQLAHVLWPSLSKCAETVMDAIAEAKLKSLAANFSERRYGRWLRYTCIPAILEDVCSGNALWNTAKHIHDTIGETLWQPAHQTRRVLARLMTELLGGPHVDSLQNRVCAALLARMGHWEAAAMEKKRVIEADGSGGMGHPASKEPDRDETVATQPVSEACQRRALVDDFLRQCQSETSIKLNRKHIWRATGHTTPRQFEYWQAAEDRLPGSTRGATAQDDLNFRRVLGTSPREFVTQLEKLGLIGKI
jgi:hypothetical protein